MPHLWLRHFRHRLADIDSLTLLPTARTRTDTTYVIARHHRHLSAGNTLVQFFLGTLALGTGQPSGREAPYNRMERFVLRFQKRTNRLPMPAHRPFRTPPFSNIRRQPTYSSNSARSARHHQSTVSRYGFYIGLYCWRLSRRTPLSWYCELHRHLTARGTTAITRDPHALD